MSDEFSQTVRSLAADRHWMPSLVLAAVLLAAAGWVVWFSWMPVPLYVLSKSARFEVVDAVHNIEAPAHGQIVATALAPGLSVDVGDVLVEIDAAEQRLRLVEESQRCDALSAQLERLRGELQAEQAVLAESDKESRLAVEEARAEEQQARAMAGLAAEKSQRVGVLHEERLVTDLERLEADAQAIQSSQQLAATRLGVDRIAQSRRVRSAAQLAHIERLQREVSRLEGEVAVGQAVTDRLRHEIELCTVRSPVSGRLGEVANLRVGSYIEDGDWLAAVVPTGRVKMVAYFSPPDALGRVQPGQTARIRLHGFPWTEFGSLPAKVEAVASEPRDGLVRVDLGILPASMARQSTRSRT